MRIHRLDIQAFGPFADRQSVDFDELGAHGIFLLHGPTGAGKTSILDAVCFALYGDVPGSRQGSKTLRSDHAAADTVPEVRCEFSTGGRRFEVTRSPKWERPSKRGSKGTTTQQAQTLLREKQDGVWVEKSTRNDEAAMEITAVLGMNREQFTKVVMLPQGDFAAFLKSPAHERQALLQQLFGTERFDDIENALAAEAARARADLGEAESQLARLRDRIIDDAEHLARVSPPAAGEWPDAEDPKLMECIRREVAERAAVHEAGLTDAGQRAAAAARDRDLIIRRRSCALELARFREAERELEQLQEGYRKAVASLADHRRAELLVQPISVADAAVRQAADSRAAAEAAVAGLSSHRPFSHYAAEAGWEHTDRAPDEIVLDTMLSRVSAERAVAEAGMPLERRRKELTSALEAMEESLLRARRELEEADRDHDQLVLRRTQLESEHQAFAQAAARAEASAEQAKEALELVAVVEAYRDATARADRQRGERDQCRRDYLDRKQQWLDLLERRLALAAAELAARLTEGQDCPVCGSSEHPRPAVIASGRLVTPAEEKTAHAAQEQAEASLRAVEDELAQLEQRRAGLAARGGDRDLEAVEREASRLASEAAGAANARGQADKTAAERAECETDLTATSLRREGYRRSIVQLETSLAGLRGSLAEAEEALEALCAGYIQLTDRLDDLETLQTALAAVLTAERRRAADSRALETARAALATAVLASGFADEATARGALLEHDALINTEQQRTEFEQLRERLAIQRESADIAAALHDEASGRTVPGEEEVEAAEELVRRLEADVQQARLARAMLQNALERLTQHEADHARLLAVVAPRRERFDLVQSIADTARGAGENTYRMTLTSYVLAARLEQVAIAASERLAAMTNGRYTLVHSDARASHGRRSGLGLYVSDEWTGQQRDTSTLSGGESFMASLSLALGLADVVQQESGGVDIETLFVDEGFGSLDEEALEQVMDALEGLRDGGRVVGLVSHVAEMKQRIPAQLRVSRSRTGSTLEAIADPQAVSGAAL